MNRRRTLALSLAVGLAAVAGVFALGRTLTLGQQAHAASDRQVAQRTAQLDRYEASLRRALAQKTPPLPSLPAQSASVAAAAPTVRVVYHRPPTVVVTTHRGEHEDEGEHGEHHEVEGAHADD